MGQTASGWIEALNTAFSSEETIDLLYHVYRLREFLKCISEAWGCAPGAVLWYAVHLAYREMLDGKDLYDLFGEEA